MPSILQKDLTKIILYLVGTVLLAALLSPPLFFLGKKFAVSVAGSSLLDSAFIADLHDSIANSPFRRYFNRAVLVSALLLAWPTYRWLRAGGEMGMGLQRDPHRWLHLFGAFVLGAGSLILMGAFYLKMEWYLPREDGKPLVSLMLSALASGVVVALLEEFFFRGILFGLVRRTVGQMAAFLFIAAFFALIHFMSPPESAVLTDDEVGWGSGLWLAGKILGEFANPSFIFASFATLFVLGLVLGWSRIRTGGLWLPIGLHAGIVFGMKVFLGRANERGNLKEGDFMPWAGEGIAVGLTPLIVLAIDGLIIFAWLRWRGLARD